MSIRKADLIKYKVQDSGNDLCLSCHIIGNSPIVIAGKSYCVWCVISAATQFLGDRRFINILRRAKRMKARRDH